MYDYDDNAADNFEIPEDFDASRAISIEQLRDHALILFTEYLARQSGIKQTVDTATLEEKAQFLSLRETEQITRDFCAADNGEFMAVGGDSPQAAVMQITRLMRALMRRIGSNIVAEGVNRGYLDVWFDGPEGAFAFDVSEAGKAYVATQRELFDNDPDEDAAE